MSVPKLNVVFSRRAARDVQNIQEYTLERWGKEQAAFYSEAMLDALLTLQTHPLLGTARDDLLSGVRSFHCERHTIFYRVTGDDHYIHRVLHERANASPGELS